MKIEVTTEQLNQILNALAQQPFIQVHEIINELQQQAQAQLHENTEPKKLKERKPAKQAV
ncbi:hypothetical protein [Aquimarina longa]|uniref:hypothetical protein n=1 Tax=Aquimarina longa TaxID=1080221 RepID=UPI000785BA93|nr:hypothetical protein [Aquimarina longa]